MRISTKGRYGLRALIDLAMHSKDDPVSLYSIAERQAISENYLEHVFSALRKAEIVGSVKGAQGGYTLSESPANINVGSILTVLEGNLSITDAESESDNDDINIMNYCIKQNLWDKIDELVFNLLNKVTLQDLIDEYKKQKDNMQPIYYI